MRVASKEIVSIWGLPDIDLDFPQSRRPEVKKYLSEKYGEDHVCGIGTLSTLQPRGVLADLSRAMKIPHEDSRAMAKIIEGVNDIDTANVDVSWDEVLQEAGGELGKWAEKYPELFEKMGEMVGLVRQSGTHAAGVLVSSEPLTGGLPTRVKNSQKVSAFTGEEVEELGFVKFDVLGIRHLDTLQVARDLIKKRHGVDLDFYSFGDKEFLDPEIWGMFETGDVNGIFQAEAAGMRRVGMDLKPKSERDLSVLYAVNRPGVVRAGQLHPFLRRWNGKEEVHYDHPMMEGIVGRTMGILIFQEQILSTVKKLANFSPGEADRVRKIMGKMLYSEMKKKKSEFIERTLKNEEFVKTSESGDPRADAEKIWASIEAAGVYSFNESHSVAYATLSAWEVWTKHYYFPEFITALMQTDPNKINRHIREARRRGIRILPPDVNESGRKFTLNSNGEIRYGLDTISHVGGTAVRNILENRPYESLGDFLDKTSGRSVNKRVVTNLIKVGAFDSLGERSDVLQEYYDRRGIKDKVPDYTDPQEVYKSEMELVGTYILVDPMQKYDKAIEKVCVSHPSELKNLEVGEPAKIGGQITNVRPHKTKRGNPMGFLDITWSDEVFSMPVFPEAWGRCQALLQKGAPVVIGVLGLEDGYHMVHVERLDYLFG